MNGIPIVSLLLMSVLVGINYRLAKEEGTWSWKLLLGLVCAIALFGAGFIVPVVYSPWLERHPALFFPILFGGMMLFVAGMYVVAWRVQHKGRV